MQAISTAINKIEDFFVGLLLVLISITIIVGVFTRYVMHYSLEWSLEFTVLCFTWMVLVGAAISIRENDLLRIDFIAEKLPNIPRRVLDVVTAIITIMTLLVLIYGGIKGTITSNSSKMTTINLSWGYSYAAIPVGAALALLHIILRLFGISSTEGVGDKP